MIFKDETYDKLRWIQSIVIPAISTCIIAIASIVGWKHALIIGGIIEALNTCFGTILKSSHDKYYEPEESVVIADDEIHEVDHEDEGVM